MNIEDIESYINKLTDNQFIFNPLFEVCIEETLSTKYIVNNEIIERSYQEISKSFANSAKILLKNCTDGISLNFKGVNVNQFIPYREELIKRLDNLILLIDEDK